MRPLKVILTIDVVLQGLLLLAMAALTILHFWSDEYPFIEYAFPVMLTLGLVQFLSTIVVTAAKGSDFHKTYLLLILFGFPAILLGAFLFMAVFQNFWIVLVALFGIPILGAVYYFTGTIKDCVRELTRPVSFWNLK